VRNGQEVREANILVFDHAGETGNFILIEIASSYTTRTRGRLMVVVYFVGF